MNVIRLMGGLGNQLFQYAFGRVQKENGIEVRYDNFWYLSAHRKSRRGLLYPRPYILDKFCTNVLLSNFSNQNTINEENTGFSLDLLKIQSHNFEGYWQYLPYYKEYLPLLRKEFHLRAEVITQQFLELRDQILSCNSVSVHIRQGDYRTHRGVFRDLKVMFYYDAIKETSGDLFIFSDDIPWCKEKFNQDYFSRKVTFIELPDYLSFELMKSCKTHIISNSTYSYWGALLSENPTICPKYWLGEKEIDTKELHYPKEWTKIEDYVVY